MQKHEKADAALWATFTTLPALLSMLMFFIYAGVRVGLGLWAYTLLTESRAASSSQLAGFITGSYGAMFTVGRIIAGWYTRKLSGQPAHLYSCCALAFDRYTSG